MATATTTSMTIEQVYWLLEGAAEDVDTTILAELAKWISENGSSNIDDAILDSLAEALPVTVRAWDDGCSESEECDYGDDYSEVAEKIFEVADYGDGDYRVTISWEATDAVGREIDSGSFSKEGETEEPECPAGGA